MIPVPGAFSRRAAPPGAARAARLRLPAALGLLLAAAGCGRAGEDYSREVLRALDQGKVTGTRATMETLGRALTACSLDRGGYPQGTMREAAAALTPAYLAAPATVDAWGNQVLYRSDSRSFTLTSPGADGRAGTADDIVMVDGRFTQVPAATVP
jgi:hypothetical protein